MRVEWAVARAAVRNICYAARPTLLEPTAEDLAFARRAVAAANAELPAPLRPVTGERGYLAHADPGDALARLIVHVGGERDRSMRARV